ncbi:hypothetical protein KUA24_94 [Vibrio phage HNL01]|nr:hypothetical protein KUA24_94 [Vibrio phage HNL01]
MKARDKRFLSDGVDEFGSVCWSVKADKDCLYEPLEASIRLADGYKAINLEFSTNKLSHHKKSLIKIRTLIESLEEFEDSLKKAGDEIYSVSKIY